jgi:hypothetical protein
MERSLRKQAIGRGDRGRQISKEDGSWTTQQAEKATSRCFGEPHEMKGNIGLRSPKNAGQVDLGF